jgi:hypothetical protein
MDCWRPPGAHLTCNLHDPDHGRPLPHPGRGFAQHLQGGDATGPTGEGRDSRTSVISAAPGQGGLPTAESPALAVKRGRVGGTTPSIEVEGFSGIGKRATLRLHTAPGLTLLVGRNGLGESSFSDALEMHLRGTHQRGEKRIQVWKGGWSGCVDNPLPQHPSLQDERPDSG